MTSIVRFALVFFISATATVLLPLQSSGQGTPPKTDQASIQGTWVVVAAEKKGKKLTDDELADLKLTMAITDNVLTTSTKGQPEPGSKFTLDSAKNPKSIDFFDFKGRHEAAGIYRFDGDNRFTIRISVDRNTRPADFTSPLNDSDRQLTLVRKAK